MMKENDLRQGKTRKKLMLKEDFLDDVKREKKEENCNLKQEKRKN